MLRLLETAQAEWRDAMAWYAAQAPGLDDAFLLELLRAFELIERYPEAGHPLASALRRRRLRRFPYGVIYARVDDGILVLAIAHLHRRPGYWRDRLAPLPE